MFSEDLVVTGAEMLGSPAVTAAVPSIGMEGTLTPHIAGEVTASIRNAGFTLYLDSGTRSEFHDAEGTDLTVAYTPTDLAPVMATVARPGFNIFQQQIDVLPSFGTLAGSVVDADNGNAPVAGARVYGFAEGAQGGAPLFDLTTKVRTAPSP